MACVNLKERFGNRFKVEFEESYYAERPEFRATEARWLMIIPCENGHLCPAGGESLMACTNRRGPVAQRLVSLAFVTVAQDGDDGINSVFDIDHFEAVAAIMKPRKRRHLSPERRERMAAVGMAALERWRNANLQGGSDERRRVSRVQDDAEAIPARPNAKSVPESAPERRDRDPATTAAGAASQLVLPGHRVRMESSPVHS